LTYRWPPQGGGGVQRTLKLVKYLSALGWRIVVHTVQNPYSRLWDAGLDAEVPPEVTVHRTPTFEYETLRHRLTELGSDLRRTLRSRGLRDGKERVTDDPGLAGEETEEIGTRESRRRRGRLARLEDWIWSRLLVPDPQIVWARIAYRRTLAIARRERPAALYSSSPPNSINVLALSLAQKLALPWIADLRDPWTDGLRRRQWYPDNPARQRREEAWERAIFERANHVLVTTEPARATFLEKYPAAGPDRVSVLTNGFDPADFAHVSPAKRQLEPGYLHLSLSGNVESMFDLGPFLEAVRQAAAADPGLRDVLRINFLGTKRQPRYDQIVAEQRLGDVIRFHSYMPHERVVQLVADSDALMLCQIPAMESGGVKLPGKMFEYLYTRKPILALTIPGETTAILARVGVGRVVDPGDVAGIRREIERLVAEHRAGGLPTRANEEVIAEFDRSLQARRVSTLFERALAEGPRPSTAT
jgi:glycosyltransferase involved in cell wall biosynthesis